VRHVVSVSATRNAYKSLVVKPEEKRMLRREDVVVEGERLCGC
jgi:hypothetical protein